MIGRRLGLLTFLAGYAFWVEASCAGLLVGFDRAEYEVTPGGSVVLGITFDADDLKPENQPWEAGLASVGLRLTIAEGGAVLDPADISLAGPFCTSNGFNPGPIAAVGDGTAEVFGVIDFYAESGYRGTSLATFVLTNSAPVGSHYAVSLDFYFADTRTNFADYPGTSLDGKIHFGNAVIAVVPEPGTGWLLFAGITVVAGWRRRREPRTETIFTD